MDSSPSVENLLRAAEALRKQMGHETLGLHHLLLPWMDDYRAMAEDLALGLDFHARRREIWEQLQAGEPGKDVDTETILAHAAERSASRGLAKVHERDYARVLVEEAGWTLRPEGADSQGSTSGDAQSHPPGHPHPPTPQLDKFGRDLTAEARKGGFSPAIGRDVEMRQVLETLCRVETRNPLLVGPAGVGKTAILGELARRLAADDVPESLEGFRLIELDKSSLTAGTGGFGQIVERIKALFEEASGGGILLFLDEMHHLLGGDAVLGTEFANTFKPALARGDLACIAATTDAEYRRSVEQDAALTRRFQPIRVQALSPEATLEILKAKEERLREDFGVEVDAGVSDWLVAFARDNMRNRYFPEKALVLLDQCVSSVRIEDGTRLTRECAEAVAMRMVGLPAPVQERLDALDAALSASGLLADADRQRLLERLHVTGENLDFQPQQPEAVLLFAGEGRRIEEPLARTLAREYCGGEDRIITLQLQAMIQETDIRELLGAPPSFIGYGQQLVIHRLKQIPWCVLRCHGLDRCHPSIARVVLRALVDGWFTDSMGEKLYLANAIVLLTTEHEHHEEAKLGFGRGSEAAAQDDTAEDDPNAWLPAGLRTVVDLVLTDAGEADGWGEPWLRSEIFPILGKTYRERGIVLEWNPSAVDLLTDKAGALNDRARFSRWVEKAVANVLIPHLASGKSRQVAILHAQGENLDVRIEETTNEGTHPRGEPL